VEASDHGFNYGFPLHSEGPRGSLRANNLLSAVQNPEVVDAKIDKKLAVQRLAGQFSSPHLPQFRISPLGLVPRKTEGEFHLIHHLSFPHGSFLGMDISSESMRVSYATVEDPIHTIKLAMAVLWPKQISRMCSNKATGITPDEPREFQSGMDEVGKKAEAAEKDCQVTSEERKAN